MTIPRPEYPRPQAIRDRWLCLNGPWQFEIDSHDHGLEDGLLQRDLHGSIVVPFCPEAPLSGVDETDFMRAVWYRREVTIPEAWAGDRILLHFGAVDYDATVWVNGVEVGRHRGGFTPFARDLTGSADPGQPATIVVRARDDNRPRQPRGKQSQRRNGYGCFYTRTTGIWQTVWLEPVPPTSLGRPRITPLAAQGIIRIEQPITGPRQGLSLRVTASDELGIVTSACCVAHALVPTLDLQIPDTRLRRWSPSDPHLYDLVVELVDEAGAAVDTVRSYAGVRDVAIDGPAVTINGETIFQRLVLDQGFYPDGVMTAPSDEALQRDIELAQQAGFNGARLHQKIFEERFLYHADRLGYLVWGEFPDWGSALRDAPKNARTMGSTFVAQWIEALERDYSHPSIVGWCALNEQIEDRGDTITPLDDAARALFLAARATDRTRPVLDASGYSHRVAESDIYDSHDYLPAGPIDKEIAAFQQRHAHTGEGLPYVNEPPARKRRENGRRTWSIPYRGQPYFVSEFGGIGLAHQGNGWSYGTEPEGAEEFYALFGALCGTLLENSAMFGYCYTQLTDVYQEQNGIYTFDRRPKIDVSRIRAIQRPPAAIELQARAQQSTTSPSAEHTARRDAV